MRKIKGTIILLCLAIATTGISKPVKEQQKQWAWPSLSGDVNQTDANGLGEYYGFGEMEIIKLDYGIQSLQILTATRLGAGPVQVQAQLRTPSRSRTAKPTW